MMTPILLLSLAGTLIALVVGSFWYAPITPMGRLHMKFLGFDILSPEEQKRKIEEAKPMMWKMYLGQAVLSFLLSFAVVFVITMSVQNGVPFSMAIGFPVMSWLCFVVPATGGAILWSNCDRAIAWKKFFSDILSNLVTILLIATLVSFFV